MKGPLFLLLPGPVLYTLMDACREYLTENNYPTCPCSICQYHIVQEDSFVKTPCFHYFHSACFGRYLNVFKPISDEYEDDFSGTYLQNLLLKFRYSDKATKIKKILSFVLAFSQYLNFTISNLLIYFSGEAQKPYSWSELQY